MRVRVQVAATAQQIWIGTMSRAEKVSFQEMQHAFGDAPENDDWRLVPTGMAWQVYSKKSPNGSAPVGEVWRHGDSELVCWILKQRVAFATTPLEAVAAAWARYEKATSWSASWRKKEF